MTKSPRTKGELVSLYRNYGAVLVNRSNGFVVRGMRLSPYYVDGMKISTSVEGLSVVIDLIQQYLGQIDFDVIAAPSISGIPYASVLAHTLEKRLVIDRGIPTKHGMKRRIEGDIKHGDRVIIIDDIAKRGQTLLDVATELTALGAEILKALVVVDATTDAEKKTTIVSRDKLRVFNISNRIRCFTKFDARPSDTAVVLHNTTKELTMSGWVFDAPGWLKDFSDPTHWHAAMSREARDIITLLVATSLNKDPQKVTDTEIELERDKLGYVDPTKSSIPSEAVTDPIQAWQGFPRAVIRRGPWSEFPPVEGDEDGIRRAAEHHGDEDFGAGKFVDQHGTVLDLPVRDRQDEYLEWTALRNNDGKITKITFVAEGYDYFSELFDDDEKAVVALYREFTGIKVDTDDLRADNGIYRLDANGQKTIVVDPGRFNPRNKYNIEPGIVHLSHSANSLGAEVNLAGVSGIARKKASGSLLDGKNEEELLCCNYGGNPNRHSDPLISKEAYAQILNGFRYTLANPVGLYIAAVEEKGLVLPDNRTTVPRDWWRVVRGDGDLWDVKKSRVLRLELEVPKNEKIIVGDLLAGGVPVNFAGQIAELLSVHLFVTTWKRQDASIGPIVRCVRTCCRKQGTGQLAVSVGKCPSGWNLAFPDLLPPAFAGAALLATDLAHAQTSETIQRWTKARR